MNTVLYGHVHIRTLPAFAHCGPFRIARGNVFAHKISMDSLPWNPAGLRLTSRLKRNSLMVSNLTSTKSHSLLPSSVVLHSDQHSPSFESRRSFFGTSRLAVLASILAEDGTSLLTGLLSLRLNSECSCNATCIPE